MHQTWILLDCQTWKQFARNRFPHYVTYRSNFDSVGLTFSPKLSRYVSHSQTSHKTGRSRLPLVDAYYEHLIAVERNKQNQENLLSKRFERRKAGDYAGLWYEAASMRQSGKTVTETIEALAARAKALCLQGQFGRTAKILSTYGVAPDTIQTFRAQNSTPSGRTTSAAISRLQLPSSSV